MSIIDIHVHPVSRELVKDARNLRVMTRYAPCLGDSPASVRILQKMDAAHIEMACLMGPNPWDGIALTNENVRDIVASHPDRFVGFFGPDPRGQEAAETRAEIEQAVTVWGFRGVGEIGGGDLLTDEWEVVFETCLALQVPVLVHVGVSLPSMQLRYCHPFVLDDLAHRYPELQVVAAHVGLPWFWETLAVATRHPNVHLDISAIPAMNRRLVMPVVAACLERELEDQLLFGSDFPLVDPERYVRQMRRIQVPWLARWLLGVPRITREVRHKILRGNAERLLSLTPRIVHVNDAFESM